MLNRAYRLSSSWKLFTNECEKLKRILINLKYPENLIRFTTATFLNSVMLNDQIPAKADTQANKKNGENRVAHCTFDTLERFN